MAQERKRAADALRTLQAIQIWALEHSINSFQIDAMVYPLEDEDDPEERFLYVTIFRKGDDTDEDYLRVTFGPCDSDETFFRKINNIKAFIGYV